MSYYWERLIDPGVHNSLIEQKIADGSDGGAIKRACQQSYNALRVQFHIFPSIISFLFFLSIVHISTENKHEKEAKERGT